MEASRSATVSRRQQTLLHLVCLLTRHPSSPRKQSYANRPPPRFDTESLVPSNLNILESFIVFSTLRALSTSVELWIIQTERGRDGWEMGKQRMDEVCGIERRAPPWAPRCPQTDQQEAVSVCAFVSLFVRKTKEKEQLCAQMHIRVSVCNLHACIYVYFWVYTSVGGCIGVCACAKRDVCRQWAWTEKCIGMSQKTADNTKTKLYPCPSGSWISNSGSSFREEL